MNFLKNISLRVKITVLSGLIIALVVVGLTFISISNLDRFFVTDFVATFAIQPDEYQIMQMEDIEDTITATEVPMADASIVMSTVDNQRDKFSRSAMFYMISLALIGTVAIYFTIGYALRPLNKLSKKMREIDEKDLADHVENSTSSVELYQLTVSFNRMLDKLNRAFEAQRNFSSAAAHELKTPLACIATNIDVLELDDNPNLEDYKETIEVAKRNTSRLMELVDDLLEMRGNDQNAQEDETISLSEIFDEIVEELADDVAEKDIDVNIECNHDEIFGNRPLLYRAFYNLVENAVKYNQVGGRIDISSHMTLGDKVIVSVEDTGVGIPQNELKHIFEPFYRVDKSRSRSIGGSGVGLSIVENVIERHNGTVLVRSNEGAGTCFEVVLPVGFFKEKKDD